MTATAVAALAGVHVAAPSTAPPPDAVELRSIVKEFGGARAVDDVSLKIAPGDFAAFIGPSGCGKTTTLRLIAGLEQPTAGEIYSRGRRIDGGAPWQRDMPLVWQNFALFPFLSVIQNVEFGLRMRRVGRQERRRKALSWLERVGIGGLADRSVSQLSGGQRQRVALARCLALDPSILLLDEPLGSLDAHLRIVMQSELKTLQRDLGITFIYVTHNQSEAFAMANKVIIMNNGRLQQIGTPQQVYRHPRNRFVAEFVGTNNLFAGKVSRIAADRVVVATSVGELRAKPPATALTVGQVVTLVVSADTVKTDAPDELENRMVGRIAGEEFVGSVVTLFVTLSDGSSFRIQKQQHEIDRLQAQLGEPLAVSWAARSTYVLPE
jgi:spermidine/putrescine transport system ATP-binding protein